MDYRSRKADHNGHPLIVHEAKYIGRATPQQTTQGPEIILEPLRTLYFTSRHKRGDLLAATSKSVKIHVYSSGIVIQQQGSGQKDEIDWYPIQNLYCSAGLKPDKSKSELIFRQLHEKVKSESYPIFSFVVRQPDGEGRRVLMCHAFVVYNQTIAQQLVNATQHAYSNKSGWNNPINDKEFLNAKLSYTLQRLDEEEDASLEQLKIKTEERDIQLAQRPDIHSESPPGQNGVKQFRSSTKTSVKQPLSIVRQTQGSVKQSHASMGKVQQHIHERPHSAAPIIVQSAPGTPRRMMLGSSQRSQYVVPNRTHSVVMQHTQFSRTPTQRAMTYYQGFASDTMNGTNGYGVQKPASIAGFPLSRSSTGVGVRSQEPTPQRTPTANYVKPVRASRRGQQRSEAAQRGHRVLASSEPQEVVNGYSNGDAFAVIGWDEMIDDAHMNRNGNSPVAEKKNKHSKHHRPSRKMMQTFSHQNGEVSDTSLLNGGHKKTHRSSSQSSVKSDSSYSITRLEDNPGKTTLNGFFQAHEHADQNF